MTFQVNFKEIYYELVSKPIYVRSHLHWCCPPLLYHWSRSVLWCQGRQPLAPGWSPPDWCLLAWSVCPLQDWTDWVKVNDPSRPIVKKCFILKSFLKHVCNTSLIAWFLKLIYYKQNKMISITKELQKLKSLKIAVQGVLSLFSNNRC